MLPDTSIEAFKSVHPEMLAEHYQRILKSLQALKIAIYEEIATHAGFPDKNQVSRRLKELEGMELVYKPGTKKPTSTGRNAYQYSLRNSETKLPEIIKPLAPETTTAADFANMIIAGTKGQRLIQKDLFSESQK